MKKFSAVLVAILVVVGFAYYMLILQVSSVDRSLYSIDLDQIRKLATETEGSLPTAINAEAPVSLAFPGAAVVTGWVWDMVPMPIYAYEVVYPQGHIMIDSSMNAEQAAAMATGDIPFDDASYERLTKALSDARLIVFTHEHPDHVGGAVAHPQALDLLDNVRLTERQLSDLDVWGGVTYPDGALDDYQALSYDRLYALAPGVVLIEAAGHTPGSQMVYVQRQDGQEYLFIGDVAWNYAGIELVLPRPNLVSRFLLGEDRARAHAEVAALKDLADANSELAIVVGHDGPRTRDQIERGLLGDRFQ